MGIKQFFKKAGSDLKTFFKKDGTLDKTFKKGGTAEKFVNKIGAGLDTGLKTVGNIAGKVGGVVSQAAPALALIPGVGPEIAAGAYAAGKAAQQVQKGVSRAEDLKKRVVKGFHNPIKMISATPILAPKPEEMMTDSGGDMTGPDGSAVNFA